VPSLAFWFYHADRQTERITHRREWLRSVGVSEYMLCLLLFTFKFLTDVRMCRRISDLSGNCADDPVVKTPNTCVYQAADVDVVLKTHLISIYVVQKMPRWKLVHGDVFRPPQCGMLLSLFIGSGVQIFFTTLITLGMTWHCFTSLITVNL